MISTGLGHENRVEDQTWIINLPLLLDNKWISNTTYTINSLKGTGNWKSNILVESTSKQLLLLKQKKKRWEAITRCCMQNWQKSDLLLNELTVWRHINFIWKFSNVYFKTILDIIQDFSICFIRNKCYCKTFCAKPSSTCNLSKTIINTSYARIFYKLIQARNNCLQCCDLYK